MGEKIDAQWYEDNYTPWIEGINSYEDLEKFWANLNPRYKRRFDHWFKDIELNGCILELGFNNGKTLKWIDNKYKNIDEFYGIDFNPKLEKIIPFLEGNIYSIDKLIICNILHFSPYGSYDHILCLDFIEHLHYDDYIKSIDVIKRELNPGGRVYVFAGYAKLTEHVNILSLEEIREDFKVAGFKVIEKISYPETGDHLQIFEKDKSEKYIYRKGRFHKSIN